MFETGPRTVWRQCYTWGDRFWPLRIEAWGSLLHKEVVAVILFLTVLIRLITVIDIKKMLISGRFAFSVEKSHAC